MAMINRPQNPNAAKVFINWFLSQEGQAAYVKYSTNNTRRTDVDTKGNPDSVPNPNIKYPFVVKEENLDLVRERER